jgi:hypothetical protein
LFFTTFPCFPSLDVSPFASGEKSGLIYPRLVLLSLQPIARPIFASP